MSIVPPSVLIACRTSLALLAAGCVSYTALPLATQADLATALPSSKAAPAGPLGIEDVVRLALERSPDLVAARAKRGVARAQTLQAGILPNPGLSGAFLPLLSGVGTVPAWSVGLTQDIKSLIVYKPKVRSARHSADQVSADLLWQEWQVAGQARQLAVDIIQGDRLRPSLAETVDLLDRRDRATQAALLAGNATLVTATPSAARLQAARVALQTLDQNQLQLRHKLNALLGLDPGVMLPLVHNPDLPAFDAAAIRASLPGLPDRRPDLLALRLGYAAQDDMLRVAILSQFPDLVLGGSVASDNAKVINGGPNLSIGLPIFDRNQGNIAIARATRAQLNAEYSARLASVTGEVGALLAEMEQIEDQLARQRQALPQARLAAERASVAFARSDLDEAAYVDLVANRLNREQEIMTLETGLLDRRIAIDTLVGAGLPGVDTLGLENPATVAGR